MKQSQNDSSQPFDGIEPPNHTQVPNALFDELMCQMKEAELRVTLAICRYTFGWHKKEDEISLSRLQTMTGLSRQGVIQGTEAGMKRGVIRRRPKGQSFVYRLRLVNVVDQLGADNGIETQAAPQLVNVVDQLIVGTSQLSRPVPPAASQLSGLADTSTSQLSGLELVNYVDTQKKGNKESPPPTENAAKKTNGDGGDSFTFLTDQGIGAASEFASIPYAIIRADYDARKADGQTKATIVKAWRTRPPTASTIFGQPRASPSAPLIATQPNVPDQIVSRADMARLLNERKRPDAAS